MKWIIAALMVTLPLAFGSVAQAQPAPKDTPWSVEFAIGWDNSISGNINSSGIGTLNGQAVVVTKNSYDDVYGTGLHIRFGGGYLIDDITEVRATFSLQSLDANLTEMGDIGTSRLYGQYNDYQSFGLDVGLRRYVGLQAWFPRIRRRDARARVHRGDRHRARRAGSELHGGCHRLLRPDGGVHAGRQRRRGARR